MRPAPVTGTGTATVDDLDEALLGALFRDGRATLAELQAATGQSEDVLRHRLDRLRTNGVLYFAVQYAPEHLGHDVDAMLWLTVTPSALSTVGHALAAHPEVEFAAASTGPANIVASVSCRDTEHLYRYLSDDLGALSGIQSAETTLTLRRIKQLALGIA